MKTTYEIIAVHYDHESGRITSFRIHRMGTGLTIYEAPVELSRDELIKLQHSSIELMAKVQLTDRIPVAVTLVEVGGQEYFRTDENCIAADDLMKLIHY